VTSVAMLFCFPVQNFTEIGLSAAELWPKTIFITAAVLTVKHILVDCVDLNDVRNKHFVVSSIKDSFDNIESHKIIDFIKETRFYKQL